MQNSFSEFFALEPSRAIPAGLLVYAIGDIHGRLDLLLKLEAQIQADAATIPAERRMIIYMGDYVDRGPDSAQVIEHLVKNPLPGFECIYLKGNHEAAMLDFLDGAFPAATWMLWGGRATLYSYGIQLQDPHGRTFPDHELRRQLGDLLNSDQKSFLDNLKLYFVLGDYLFVHAGVRPGAPLEKQEERDLLMIREAFIESDSPSPKRVVFGHTIFAEPYVKYDKIGVDTGAFATNRLTALVLKDTHLKFISTGL